MVKKDKSGRESPRGASRDMIRVKRQIPNQTRPEHSERVAGARIFGALPI